MEKDWIVIADDNLTCMATAGDSLKKQGMRVSMVSSGEELMSFLERNKPDLILLEYELPGMDGFETYDRIREFEDKEGRRQTAVIFTAENADSETEEQGLKMGALDFIKKPYNEDVLARRISNAVKNIKTIENLTDEAMIDKLTGFINKTNATEKMTHLCKKQKGVLLVMDLDNFKLINDFYGHEMGDRVLTAFADITRRNTRVYDVLCRIGGDEFCGFFRNVTEEEVVSGLISRLNDQIREECVRLIGDDFNIPIGVSAGVVFVPDYGTEYSELFQIADRMLYQVKQSGRHNYAVYQPGEDGEMSSEYDTEQELARLTQLFGERTEAGRALLVGQDPFTWIYRYMLRFMKRYKKTAMKLLFTLTFSEGISSEAVEVITAKFSDTLQVALRKSDIITQSRKNQFFLFLPDLKETDGPAVIQRILSMWEKHPEHEKVRLTHTMEYVDFAEDENKHS